MATRMDSTLNDSNDSADMERNDRNAFVSRGELPITPRVTGATTRTDRHFPPPFGSSFARNEHNDHGGREHHHHLVGTPAWAHGGSAAFTHAPPALSSLAIGVLAVASIVVGIFMMVAPFLFTMSLTAALALGVVGAWFAAAGTAFVFTKRPNGI
jgi:hypothetical protein